MAKRTLAANLKDDLSSYNEEMWTEDIEDDESIDGGEAKLVEALLTGQGFTHISKGKKRRLYDDSEGEEEEEYYEEFSGSDESTPKKPQEGPSGSSIISIPGKSLLDQIQTWC